MNRNDDTGGAGADGWCGRARALQQDGFVKLDVYGSVGLFVLLRLPGLTVIFLFPGIAVWLPNTLDW